VKPRECNEWDVDAGAELDALSAERGLRHDRIEYSDPSLEYFLMRVHNSRSLLEG
jgi:hypothetical protein